MKRNKLILDKQEILNVLGNDYGGLASILSDKFGIINAMLERNELSKYSLYMYQCLSANAKDLFNLDREVSSGGLGISETKNGAMISCLAEALERYCMSFIPQNELYFEKLDKLEKNKVFKNFHTYSPKQYSDNHFIFSNPSTDLIYWTKIYSVKNKRNWKYWPASLIYLPFSISKPVAENTSTGMAAGKTIDECISSGLLELLERDALMINFMQKLNPPEIELSSIKGLNEQLLKKISANYTVKIYRLYSDINVPIYLSLIWKKVKGKTHFGIGASANINSDWAINKALKECLFTFFYSQHIMDLKKDNPNEINALYEHFLYYQGSNFKKILFKSSRINYVPEKTTLKEIIGELEKNGIDVYYKELTTSDIKATNIRVVKVIAPGLVDLNKSHIYPRLGARRFWEVPQKLNLKYGEKLSDEPHPFP